MDVIEGNFLLMTESYEKYIQLFFHPQIRKKCVYIYIYIYIYAKYVYYRFCLFFFLLKFYVHCYYNFNNIFYIMIINIYYSIITLL